jgi:hypothetical protein
MMIAVEETSWKGIHACGMAESPAKEFYSAMIRRLSQCADARVIMARYENEDIGFIAEGSAVTEIVNVTHRGFTGEQATTLIVFHAGTPGMPLSQVAKQ